MPGRSGSRQTAGVLVGRESERRTLERLIAGARVGQSGVLVLAGEAGMGKSALLQAAADLSSGMQVLRAEGSPADRDVAFGGLLQLLRPALGLLEAIPPPQADALGTALALHAGTGGDRFAVGAATLSLLSRFAQDSPVAVLVDNAHLLDRPSAEAVTFAARRLMADPIYLAAAVRPGADTLADLPTLELTGLGLDDAASLLAASGAGPVDAELLTRLHAETGGNPLALIELASDPAGLQRHGQSSPLPVPDALVATYARRLDRLGAPARTVLLLAALCGGELTAVGPACALIGVDLAAIGEAEHAGLVHLAGGRAIFRHPLIAAAVYQAATGQQRREAHRVLAGTLPAEDADRRAWHRAEASLGPDEGAAAALDEVGRRSRHRRAHAVAATAFERAARLTAQPGPRARRLLEAGEAAWLAGQTARAMQLLLAAGELRPPPAQRLRIQEAQGMIALRRGSVLAARDTFVQAADEAAADQPDRAVCLLADAVHSCFYLADGPGARRAGEEIDRLLARTSSPGPGSSGRWRPGWRRSSSAAAGQSGSGSRWRRRARPASCPTIRATRRGRCSARSGCATPLPAGR